MKNYIIIISLLIALNTYSQDSTLDIIAKETCEYLQKDEIRNLDNQQKTLKLGIFIINLYSEYKEDLKAEGIDIDFTEDDAGRKFGEKIGINMVNFCPEALIALASDVDSVDYDTDTDKAKEIYVFNGEIQSIKGNDFSFVEVKNSDGIVQKFLWFSNFKGSEKLIANDSIIGTKVKVKYKNTECFSPKLEEYIIRKEIIEIGYFE